MPAHVNHSDYFKKLRIVIGLIVMVCVGGTISLFIRHRASIPSIEPKDILRRQSTSQRLEFRGFRYDGNLGGKRVISIKADRFSIEKKKLGFLRFGLLNEARLDNAVVHIYGNAQPAQAAADGLPDKPGRILTFNNFFKKDFIKESMFGLPLKRISAISMAPASVVLHDEKSVVTRIAASSAVIRLKQRDIIFKGNVKAVSGSAVLTTDRLIMIPESAILKTDSPFVKQTPVMTKEGRQLTTDIFLSSK